MRNDAVSLRNEARPRRRLVLPFLGPLYDGLSPLMEPLVRIVAGLSLLPHGSQKLFGAFGGGGLAGTAQFLDSAGYAPGMFWAVAIALTEFVGGLLLALGLFTRPAAAAVAVFMAVAVLQHSGSGFFWTNGGLEYPLLWGVVALYFAIRGGGPYSLDARLGREI